MQAKMSLFPLTLALLLSPVLSTDVVTVTGANFEEVVKKNANVLVEFYAPWCGHCKKLDPEYEKAAKKLKAAKQDVVLAKCDATDAGNSDLKDKYEIRGFPTLKIFKGGDLTEPMPYNGPRDATGIVDYVMKLIGPASVELEDKKSVEKFIGKGLKVVGVFVEDDSSELKTFLKVADSLREDAEFGHSLDASFVKMCDDDKCKKGGLFLVSSEDGILEKYDSDYDAASIKKWITKLSSPKLVELSQYNANGYEQWNAMPSNILYFLVAKATSVLCPFNLVRQRNGKNPIFNKKISASVKNGCFVLRDPRHAKAVKQIFGSSLPRLLAFSNEDHKKIKEFRDELISVNEENDGLDVLFVDPKKNERASTFFSLKENDFPALIIHDHTNNKKYVAEKASPGDIKGFVADFKAKKLTPHFKSEEIPESNDEPVKVVVGKSFNEIVLDSGKTVLVEFYAPWCGHCKKLTPIYNEVAEHFKDNDKVVITKMDGTTNDIPDNRFKVKGFPTINLVTPAGEVLAYDGKRLKEDIIKFVTDNTSSEKADKEDAEEEGEEEEEQGEDEDEDEDEYEEEEDDRDEL